MVEKVISPLRQRMIEDMTVRHFKENVQKDYIRHVKNFTAFLGRSPDTATSEDLRPFQLHMARNQVSPASVNCAIVALRASDLGIAKRHERGRWRNNRAENSHQPTRRRERKMQGLKSVGSAQRFLSVHAATHNTFNVQRHLTSARTHRAFRASALQTWREVVAAA
jgi:hypothetical protein